MARPRQDGQEYDMLCSYRVMLALREANAPDEHGHKGRYVEQIAERAGISQRNCGKILSKFFRGAYVTRFKIVAKGECRYYRWHMTDDNYRSYERTIGAQRQEIYARKHPENATLSPIRDTVHSSQHNSFGAGLRYIDSESAHSSVSKHQNQTSV